jgi:hypothetical protein
MAWEIGDTCFEEIADAIENGDLTANNPFTLHEYLPELSRCIARVTGLGRNLDQFLERTDNEKREKLALVIKNVTGIEPRHDQHLFDLIREHRSHMDRLKNGEITEFRLKKVVKFARHASAYFT